MIECIDKSVRDALPDLLDERLGATDRATLVAHIECCEVCRRELELLREVRRSAPLAPSIDIARIVAALPLPKRDITSAEALAIRTSGTSWHSRALWMTAATVAIAIAIGTLSVQRKNVEPAARPVATTANAPAELVTPKVVGTDSVIPISAQPAVAARIDVQRPRDVVVASTPLAAGVQDLSDENLEALIAELEEIEALPAAEPEALVVDLENSEGGE